MHTWKRYSITTLLDATVLRAKIHPSHSHNADKSIEFEVPLQCRKGDSHQASSLFPDSVHTFAFYRSTPPPGTSSVAQRSPAEWNTHWNVSMRHTCKARPHQRLNFDSLGNCLTVSVVMMCCCLLLDQISKQSSIRYVLFTHNQARQKAIRLLVKSLTVENSFAAALDESVQVGRYLLVRRNMIFHPDRGEDSPSRPQASTVQHINDFCIFCPARAEVRSSLAPLSHGQQRHS